MSTNNLLSAPICTLKELNNLFIELTEKNCNQHCKHCYIDFPLTKQVKDFIPIDKIKQTLEETANEKLNCIYLTGAEPMTHPDFNNILRTCLTRTNVCICTNGYSINEKKARFLKKVEDESQFSIIFELPLDHYNEVKNDDIRGRGTYRQVLHAIKNLNKYNFNIIVCTTNFYEEDKKTLFKNFSDIFENIEFKISNSNLKINECYKKDSSESVEFSNLKYKNLDCNNSRILTNRGVYACPFLANDHRGRMGSNFKDYGVKIPLETSFCSVCIKNKEQMFSIDKTLFD